MEEIWIVILSLKYKGGGWHKVNKSTDRIIIMAMMVKTINEKEKEILAFWKKDKTFEKSLKKTAKNKPYIFYDGPPFATGMPHHGHLLGSITKDVFGRFWTMKGRYVRRVWGWD